MVNFEGGEGGDVTMRVEDEYNLHWTSASGRVIRRETRKSETRKSETKRPLKIWVM